LRYRLEEEEAAVKPRTAKRRLEGIDLAQDQPTSAQLQVWIAEAAYYRAERRGFVPGQEVDDWLAAEAEVRAGWRQP
jgi:hypothetical protein